MKKLDGRTAIITGGTSGMGRGIAELFAAEGASVVIGGRDPDRGREATDGITAAGGAAAFVAGDIATVEANQALVDAAVSQFGGVDIVVPNAGILGNGGVLDAPLEVWRRTIDVNLNAVYYLIKLAAPVMLDSGGSIVVNGSIAAYRGVPKHPAYCAEKGTLVPLVRQLAIESGPNDTSQHPVPRTGGYAPVVGFGQGLPQPGDGRAGGRRPGAAQATGHARGRGARGALPGERRRRLDHRQRADNRRRDHHGVMDARRSRRGGPGRTKSRTSNR